MTRVLMVSSLWPPTTIGGAEVYADRLATELRQRGHEVASVTLGVDHPDAAATVRPWPYALQTFASQPRWKRVLFHGADIYRPATVGALRAAVDRFAPDVVHSHAVQGLSISALTTPSSLGVPHVHTLHDYWLLCQRTTMRHGSGERCRRWSACGALSVWRRAALTRSGPAVYLAPSAAVAVAHEPIGVVRDRVRVVRHAAEPAAHQHRRTTPNGPITVGFLGQLTESKGVRTLLAAFDRFAAEQADGARLLVAGTGPLSDELARRARPAVQVLGWIDGVAKRDFYATIDALIVPSEWDEPAGLVAVEAAARGVPVIAAAIGGLPEYVAPPLRPLMFASGDADHLRRSLTAFATHRDTYATRARAAGGDHLPTWDAHLAVVLAAYADAGAPLRRERVA